MQEEDGYAVNGGEDWLPDHRLDRIDRLDKAAGYIHAAGENA